MAESRVTQKQIADSLGLRQTTVSRALADDPRVKPSTRKRILAAAEHLGYRPNTVGRVMRDGRFGAVGLLESTVTYRGHSFGNFIYALHDALAARGLHLVISRAPDEQLIDGSFLPKILSQLMVDGLVIDYCVEIPPQLVDLVDRHRIPSVWVNVKQPHASVYYDDLRGTRTATEHLIALGHRDIAYLSFYNDPAEGDTSIHYSMSDRPEGYRRAMKRARLPERVVHFTSLGDERERERASFAEKFLTGNRPSALVTYTDIEAQHILYAAAKLGVRVPQDLSLVTTHWTPYRSLGVDVATVVLPVAKAADAASAMLARLIEHPKTRAASVALPLSLWQGESCAPFAGAPKA